MRFMIALAAGVVVMLLLATHAADPLELPARDLVAAAFAAALR